MVVKYNTKDHWSVLFQLHGSPWFKVIPYCIGNVIWMIVVTILDRKVNIHQLEITNLGHGFATLIVSFLLVSRVNMALSRYNEARACIGTMLTSTRELVSTIYAFTGTTCQTEQDKLWRHEVSYRTLLLLRSVMELIDYHERKVLLWHLPEMNGEELQYIQKCIMVETTTTTTTTTTAATSTTTITTANRSSTNGSTGEIQTQYHHPKKFRHGKRVESDEVYRVPVHLSYLLQQSIQSYKSRLSNTNEISPNMEIRSFAKVDDFMHGTYAMIKFLQTPVPFPLIQMARTTAFAFVYTVPLILVSEKTGTLLYHCLAIFFITYGMIGLEMIAIELDDPFGDDANDFDNEGMAEKANEDVYIRILNTDGPEWASKLRIRMDNNHDRTKPINEQTHLLEYVC